MDRWRRFYQLWFVLLFHIALCACECVCLFILVWLCCTFASSEYSSTVCFVCHRLLTRNLSFCKCELVTVMLNHLFIVMSYFHFVTLSLYISNTHHMTISLFIYYFYASLDLTLFHIFLHTTFPVLFIARNIRIVRVFILRVHRMLGFWLTNHVVFINPLHSIAATLLHKSPIHNRNHIQSFQIQRLVMLRSFVMNTDSLIPHTLLLLLCFRTRPTSLCFIYSLYT